MENFKITLFETVSFCWKMQDWKLPKIRKYGSKRVKKKKRKKDVIKPEILKLK